jgi:hypothetical protein
MRLRWVVFLMVALVGHAALAVDYTEVEYKALKLSPKDYKHKSVTYTAAYLATRTTFHPYMERSGFRPDKYFWLVIGDLTVPALAKSNDDMKKLVLELKFGMKVKVYGKVRKFKREPKATILPHYYVDVKNLEVILDDTKPLPRPRPRPRPRRRKP